MLSLRWLLFAEAFAFGVALKIHFGILFPGFEHTKAGVAESVIGVVLLLGWGVGMARPSAFRWAGPLAQGFALLGTLVGAFTIAIGIGPQTVGDLVFHAAILIVLIAGLVMMLRRRGS